MTTYIEEYIVDLASELASDMFELAVHRTPAGSPAPTAVSTILLLKGATSTTNRTGLEVGPGATVSLTDADFSEARANITQGDVVSYVSEPIASRRPPARASIVGFTFPMSIP